MYVSSGDGILQAQGECDTGWYIFGWRLENLALVLDTIDRVGRCRNENQLEIGRDVTLEMRNDLCELLLVELARGFHLANTLDDSFQLVAGHHGLRGEEPLHAGIQLRIPPLDSAYCFFASCMACGSRCSVSREMVPGCSS